MGGRVFTHAKVAKGAKPRQEHGVEMNGKKKKELDHSAVLCGMVLTIPQYCDEWNNEELS